MKKSILFSCLSTLIWAETVTLSPIDIQEEDLSAGTVVLSENEAKGTNSITLQERLERDVSFSVISNINGEESLSFRGLDFKATAYVEDGIPLYRSANGYVDTKFTMTDAGGMAKNVYIQADVGYYHRSDYKLSDDYRPTPTSGKRKTT